MVIMGKNIRWWLSGGSKTQNHWKTIKSNGAPEKKNITIPSSWKKYNRWSKILCMEWSRWWTRRALRRKKSWSVLLAPGGANAGKPTSSYKQTLSDNIRHFHTPLNGLRMSLAGREHSQYAHTDESACDTLYFSKSYIKYHQGLENGWALDVERPFLEHHQHQNHTKHQWCGRQF